MFIKLECSLKNICEEILEKLLTQFSERPYPVQLLRIGMFIKEQILEKLLMKGLIIKEHARESS